MSPFGCHHAVPCSEHCRPVATHSLDRDAPGVLRSMRLRPRPRTLLVELVKQHLAGILAERLAVLVADVEQDLLSLLQRADDLRV